MQLCMDFCFLFPTLMLFPVQLDAKKPIVAAVEGLALGGGLELALVRVILKLKYICLSLLSFLF